MRTGAVTAQMMRVGEVARLAKVSVRTLHHYDEIGLLGPSGRTESGYRLYTMDDLAALQQVLFFKELGFSLPDIIRIMGEPGFDRREALHAQRALLSEKARRADEMLAAIDAALASIEKGTAMNKEEMFEAFGDFDPSQYEEEVGRRWADTEAYRESKRRTKHYSKDDFARIKADSDALEAEFAAKMLAGVPADDTSVIELAERHRLAIDRDFYPCSHEFQRGLAEMYVSDPRFARHYEDREAGLARYVHDAIVANAVRAEGA
jgi:DNA-binding transcriptional MerR regulator